MVPTTRPWALVGQSASYQVSTPSMVDPTLLPTGFPCAILDVVPKTEQENFKGKDMNLKEDVIFIGK
ncbi:hypothetical protein DSO57_1033180 [Entomophthora muscae]|uniref:Uncharacterized protein n=1 Tax=Entomophthora muscae TaxID=34485 RepID=A0ACC2UL76_9FUNG|nr:hypothetical protein DSO57_1033180 [Entomophthora muscae]